MWLCKVSNICWKQRLPTTCGVFVIISFFFFASVVLSSSLVFAHVMSATLLQNERPRPDGLAQIDEFVLRNPIPQYSSLLYSAFPHPPFGPSLVFRRQRQRRTRPSTEPSVSPVWPESGLATSRITFTVAVAGRAAVLEEPTTLVQPRRAWRHGWFLSQSSSTSARHWSVVSQILSILFVFWSVHIWWIIWVME
jgi:hypothetical protein